MYGGRPMSRAGRSLTGLAAGAVLGAALLGIGALGALVGLPNMAFVVFEWLVRVLPGGLVVWGLETTLRLIEALGLDIKDTTKTVEAALAAACVFVPSTVAGLVFFLVVSPERASRAPGIGRIVGLVLGVALAFLFLAESAVPTGWVLVGALWVVALHFAWGWALGRLFLAAYPMAKASALPAAAEPARPAAEPLPGEAAPSAAAEPAPPTQPAPVLQPTEEPPAVAQPAAPAPVEAERLDRRHFVIRIGGLAATLVVLGAEVAQILRIQGGSGVPQVVTPPIPFPNASSPVRPVPGTRPEYTAVADHFTVDINLTPPRIDVASWRLRIGGVVTREVELSYEQLTEDYDSRDQFITLACVSNPVGGPLIGTTVWSGPPLRDVLATAQPTPDARYVRMRSDDGFNEVVELADVRSDPRIILAHSWNGEPLTAEHGFPVRVFIPDVYGMKQPKWITEIVLEQNYNPGYWVARGWDETAQVRTTSVIDTVDTSGLVTRGGQTYVPIGGIAEAGARGISKVEVQTDGGPWEAAELRQPLSPLTWVIWRYEWPWREGRHTFAVRAYDGEGTLQETAVRQPNPAGATGVHTRTATVLPERD